ncbi:MAG: CRISPR-associated endoribonuclease Cas6 [Spirochaetes bacterium]|nr:CRISPR-associated endoribonuclease Cas6 [Spirochaetota bacterium]
MRFAAFLEFENEHVHIPPWYRIAFASLLKEALRNGDNTGMLYSYYYGNDKRNVPKPFTFSVKLHVEKVLQDSIHKLQVGKFAALYVSSNNYEFIIALYNGLQKLKKYNIYGCPFSITRFSLLPKRECGSKEVFSIFSPIVVRRVSDDKKGIGYAHVNDEDFIKMLKYSIVSQCKFLGDSYCVMPDDIMINTNAAFPVKIPHYNKMNPDKPEIIVATDGTIEIEAPKEVVQLLYDNGIGARRSQGFGMLEVAG